MALVVFGIHIGQCGSQAVILTFEFLKTCIRSDSYFQFVELVHVGSRIGLCKLGAQYLVGGDYLDFCAMIRDKLCTRQRRVPSTFIHDEYLPFTFNMPRQHIPDGVCEFIALESTDIGNPP